MNPDKGPDRGRNETWIPGVYSDSEKTVVMLTCLVGGMLAIMATIVPKPLLNITRVTNESERVVKVLDIIWTDAIAYFCGTQRTGMRFQIKHKILKLNTTISKIS